MLALSMMAYHNNCMFNGKAAIFLQYCVVTSTFKNKVVIQVIKCAEKRYMMVLQHVRLHCTMVYNK